MGFFDKLIQIGSELLNEAQKAEARRSEEMQHRVSRQNATGRSAIPPGRMKQTDQVKGKSSPIPNQPGVYRHVDKQTGNIDYVGQTNDLRRRQREHANSGKLDTTRQNVQYSAAKPNATKDDLCSTEKSHIKRHSPTGNTTKGGNGRR